MRGDVWWVNLDPARGSELKKQRPAIVVSNNLSNNTLDRIQVVPITSNISKIFISECLVTVKEKGCKASANQIRTVSTLRLGKRISTLSAIDLAGVEKILKLQLGL